MKQTVRTTISAAHRILFHIVGEGFPLPFFTKDHLSQRREDQGPPLPRLREIRSFVRRRKVVRTMKRTVEDACPYNVCVGRCAAILFALAVCFLRGVEDVAPYKILPKYRRGELCSPVCKQTVRTNISAAHRTFFYTVGADSISARLQTNGTNEQYGGAPHVVSFCRGRRSRCGSVTLGL